MEKKELLFTDEELQNIIEYGEVLRSIHNRLISEGWTIKGGVFTTPDGISYTKENAAQFREDQKKKLRDVVKSTQRPQNG